MDLCLLYSHTPQQRFYFAVFLLPNILPRLVQVQGVDGLYDGAGKAGCQNKRKHQRQQNNDTDGLSKPHQQNPNRMLCCRKSNDGSIGKKAGTVQITAGQGIGIAAAFAGAILQGLLHLFTHQVVFHRSGIALIIIQYGAIGSNPCDAVILRRKALKKFLAIQRNPLCHYFSSHAQLLLLYPCKIAVQHPHNQYQ